MKVTKERINNIERFNESSFLTKEEIQKAIDLAINKIDKNISLLGEKYPTPATENNEYKKIDNIEWTNGFWTGMLWLCYEETGDKKYKILAEKHVDDFLNRIENNIEVEHHDLGFLYILSCVSSYKLTGNEKAKKAALLAADKLVTRYQEKGEFIQAWGELGAKDNYRLIVDCLLNIPLLYWASEETKDSKYRDIAKKHYKTTINNAIREDSSAFHTFYFDPETGEPVRGKTRQGYSDDSSWARGQAWLIYGIALNYTYLHNEEDIDLFESVTNYFLNRLPKDFVPYWDLIFGEGSEQSRDTSAGAIAICGMNQMCNFLPETNEYKKIYRNAQHLILRNLIESYTEIKADGIISLINEGVYSWHSGKGVNEGNIWGDYYYLESLIRFKKYWNMYW
ncbi:glycoside hydrolase family 88 protein [Helcococcus kunzii]|uniref:Glucuronyl hydrolase n=1 Tax=Helcococcus kunzii ATCC 51366 TaxID=883114 RepID=H3NQL9_9FIRM|nr:glycoside hydrolase family 88 protein [Helcococcus kunzii]EHR32349.1 hypothetical protein HMPREF9709_01630 [Helcococcus kunzii ATCC 51366]MCT1796512.1 glycoside hydrolase family 88 protein [Helcococcus kunzii]MCT1988324.1 glycoside hydrolase family 88 protein [Helcococcus kunzii]QZO76142.1 glycoside hydrolase family 88 protein [Helcococcus kunzii]